MKCCNLSASSGRRHKDIWSKKSGAIRLPFLAQNAWSRKQAEKAVEMEEIEIAIYLTSVPH